jgi:penicillin amidase
VTTERLRLAGLAHPVVVARDRYGIPHLRGERRPDVYRALGWVMASDRLWQMDVMRRLGLGRMAEVLGRPFLVLDVVARTLGLPEAAGQAAERLDGEAAESLAAFAAGVSAWIADHPPGPEFEALGYVPEAWRPIDSLAIEYFVGLALAMESLEAKLMLAKGLGYLGPERGAWLYPRPLPLAPLDAERLAAYRSLDDGIVAAFASLGTAGGGSNAWAVAPARTAGGAALLAGDPHLRHGAPSPWYLVQLTAPDLDVAGAAYAGGPLVQVGRNRSGAWSVTNLTADDVELVVERLDSGGLRRATAAGRWEPVDAREVEIGVRFEEPHRFMRRTTRNGPLLDPVAAAAGRTPGPAVALRWKALVAPGHSAAGWLAVHRSRGLGDVLRAAPAFDGAPYQSNFIYADADGRVAHLPLGGVPRREGALGLLPALGWRGEGGWRGIGSLGAVPWRIDPAGGAVWTANEATGAADRAADGDGQPFGEHGYRARRIRTVLTGSTGHTVAGFAALQMDDLDLSACGNLPVLRDALAGWEPDDPLVRRACDLLLGWDGRASRESAGAAVYHVLFFSEWIPLLVPEETCPGLAARWRVTTWVAEAVLRAPRSPWFADADARARALRDCAARAVVRLRAVAGDDPDAWRWGDLHRASFAHPLAFVPRLAAGALPAVPLGGSPFSVNQQRLGAALPPFGATVGAGVRMVVDLADRDHLHITLSTGQSGDPASGHFADQLPLWRAGELLRVSLDPAAGDREAEYVLVGAEADR